MDKERKIALGVLGAFSVLVIIAFFVNTRNNLRKPFIIPKVERPENQTASCTGGNCSAQNQLSADNLDLKLVDTDGDGISDWDELFVYGTSPYLEDSDGDGLSDYEEIFVYKTDPNCPQGQNCFSSTTSDQLNEQDDDQLSNQASGISGDLLGDTSLLDQLSQLDQMDQSSSQTLGPEDLNQLLNISSSELRQQLMEAGFQKEELDLISDEDLMDIYRQSLSSLDFSL